MAAWTIPLKAVLNTPSEQAFKRWTALYIISFCLVWWAVFVFSRHYLDTADMVENYAWGQEWQWGNNKHPPLFGWIVAAWFKLFPTTDWAYYLLSELNLGVALFLMALAMRRVLSAEKVLAAIVLTSLVSNFGPSSGYKYNANTAQLPFIAGVVWSMLHAMESRRRGWFIAAGVFGAAALLTKYYVLVLFLAIGLGLLITLRPRLAELPKGLALTALTAVLLVSPHLVWSIQHGWPSLHYMHAAHDAEGDATALNGYFATITGTLLFGTLALFAWAGSLIRLPEFAPPDEHTPRLGLAILVLGVALTLLAAWAQNIKPVPSWLIPVLLFLGWALLDLTPARFDATTLARRIYFFGIFYLVATLAVSVWWERRYQTYPAPPPYATPQTLANDVTRLYRETYGQALQYAAGTFPLPYILSFYSSDHPHGLYGLDLAQSPWINGQALKAGSMATICGPLSFDASSDPACIQAAAALFGTPDQVRHLVYSIYDPKSKRLGRQDFTVLTWKPPTLGR
jgi:4-amino-4-deoxy-L-arabinose transferase-like glycosyltransferase